MIWRRRKLAPVRVLRLQPGDRILYEAPERITHAQAQATAEYLKAVFPDHKAVVTCGGRLSVVRDEDPIGTVGKWHA